MLYRLWPSSDRLIGRTYSTPISFISKSIMTLVPFPTSDWMDISCDNFARICLQRYKPIPVDCLKARPLYPVKPFSKTRGKSSARIPMPVSSIINRFSLRINRNRTFLCILQCVGENLFNDEEQPFLIR